MVDSSPNNVGKYSVIGAINENIYIVYWDETVKNLKWSAQNPDPEQQHFGQH